MNSVGTYPNDLWEEVWNKNGKQVFRHYHNMQYLLPRYMKMLQENSKEVLFKPDFFEKRRSGVLGVDIITPKPVVQFPHGLIQLKYNVGTRGNGVDQARWPEDLTTEVVA